MSYWSDRAEQRMNAAQKSADQVSKELARAYAQSIQDITDDIEHILGTFEDVSDLTREEALSLLNQKLPVSIIEDLKLKVQHISDPAIKKDLETILNSEAYRSRISRKEALRDALQVEYGRVADHQIEVVGNNLSDTTRDTYLRYIFDRQQYYGIVFDFAKLPDKVISQIVNDHWCGANYSQRIWGACSNLGSTIEQMLLEQVMTGQNSRKMAKTYEELLGIDRSSIERLLRTETTHCVAQADLQGAMECGIEQMQFVATLDMRTSKVCQEHDGKIINVRTAKSGVDIPPLHPYCRSCLIDYDPEALAHKVRRARNPETGRNELVPADMTYPEWKKKYVAESTNSLNEEYVSESIDSLNEELKNLEEQMEQAMTLEEMAMIQEKQDEIQSKIDAIKKEKIEAEKLEKISAANDSINRSGLFKKEINLEGCDVKCAEAIASVSEKIKKEFPDVQFDNVRISDANMKGERFTNMDSLGKTTGTSISFNGTYMSDSEKTEALLEKMYESGKSSTGTIEGNVSHEYGHALVKHYGASAVEIRGGIMSDEGYDIKKGMPKSEFDDIFHISTYGDSDADEWFSECFADYMTNENPKEISIKAVEKFKELYLNDSRNVSETLENVGKSSKIKKHRTST